MDTSMQVFPWMTQLYWSWFVNRRAYTVQDTFPAQNGRHFYKLKKSRDGNLIPLTLADIDAHLQGSKTIGIYSIAPSVNTCKWIAIDADYDNALEDLRRLRDDLLRDNIHAAIEMSRRGGHLWVLGEEPLPAKEARLFIYNVALSLCLPIQGFKGCKKGLEIYPRKDHVDDGKFGVAIRGPLGIHRASNKRYWFDGVQQTFSDTFQYLKTLPRLSLNHLLEVSHGMSIPALDPPPPPDLSRYKGRGEYKTILEFVDYNPRKLECGNFRMECPSCARIGEDPKRHHLTVKADNPYIYRCLKGCTKEQIWAALGNPDRRPNQNIA